MITREALRILHQKLNFVTNIVTDYDDSYAKEGAKIGNSLRIRNPIQYATGTGATMATGTGADTLENKVTLTVNTQRHVPMRFTSNELTMTIDDFSKRHIEPAMAILAAKIESDAFNMVDEVSNAVSAGTAVSFAEILQGRKKLVDNLAPVSDRCAILDTQAHVDTVDALKGLFHDSNAIKKQYKEGIMGRTAGMDFYENTLLPAHTTGAEGGLSNYLCNAVTAQVGSHTSPNSMSLIVDTGTKTVKEGDVFTIANVFEVDEAKTTTTRLRQFTVLADFTGAGTITISPAIIATGPYQNCSAGAANNAALTFIGAASTAYNQSLLFQKGFAAFATADLVLPNGTDFASRQVYDGISMRIIRDYDIVKDRILTRLDVLYGYKVLRPQLACKVWHT
jgi:hypothetical protein